MACGVNVAGEESQTFLHLGVAHFLRNLRFVASTGRDNKGETYAKWAGVMRRLQILFPQWAMSELEQADLSAELAQMFMQSGVKS